MSKYEELLSQKINTKQQLLETINKLPDDVVLIGRDADLGGYDTSEQPYITIGTSKNDKGQTEARFGHLEYTAYDAFEKEQITEEQLKEFMVDDSDEIEDLMD